MALSPSRKVVALVAAVAVLFGVATLVAGSRVLLGSDPGYAVFTPLLLFNTLMGFAYIAVGVLAWRRTPLAVRGAAVIALLNVAVLGGIALLYTRGGPVAVNSLQAMGLRAAVWIVLFLVLLLASRVSRHDRGAGSR